LSKDQEIKAFLSHADLDREKAGMLRSKLSSFRIDVFVAHDDLEGGEEWRKMLISKIKECNVFLALLTPNFHIANFTEQEAGAAIALEKPIIPISLNGQKSYGFVTDYQDSKLTDEMSKQDIQKLAQNIYRRAAKTLKESLDLLIQNFEFAGSWDQANKLSNIIAVHQKDLNQEQVKNIAKAFLKNDQIRGSWGASPFVEYLLQQNEHLLGLELKNKVNRMMAEKQQQQQEQRIPQEDEEYYY
jgi:hypothetical protein